MHILRNFVSVCFRCPRVSFDSIILNKMALNEISLKWNGFQMNMLNNLKALFYNQGYTDVTLVSEGESLKAHKVVLSACSPLFSNIFTQNPYKHPIIILQGVSLFALQTLLTFIYNGEVNVTQEFLPELLKAAESLKIKGLSVVEDLQAEVEERAEILLKRKLPWSVNTESQSARKNPKIESINFIDDSHVLCDIEQVIPKTEPPELVWSETEANIDEGTDTMDSTCRADGDAPHTNQTCEIPHNYNHISNQTNSTNLTTQPKNTSKNITKKKKTKLKNRNKIICLNADLDKSDELIESGKENIVAEIELEKGLEDSVNCEQTIAVEALTSFVNINCEPDLETECKEVSGINDYKSPKFPCPFCTRIYHTWGYRRRHIKTRHRADKPVCKVCALTCASQASWFEHVIRKHEVARVEARKCLVVLMEAHAVLTNPTPPSPSVLLADIPVDDIE